MLDCKQKILQECCEAAGHVVIPAIKKNNNKQTCIYKVTVSSKQVNKYNCLNHARNVWLH